jgi:hypothetical protein
MRSLLKRRWPWATMLLAGVVGVGYLVIPLNETGVSKASFDRIQKGWTQKQVVHLLGGWGSGSGGLTLRGATADLWWGDESDLIMVVFEEGVVTDKSFTASLLTPWERVKRRVARRIRAAWPGS